MQQRPPSAECRDRHNLLQRMEERMAHAPTGQDLHANEHRAHQRMDTIERSLNLLAGSVKRIESTLDVIQRHLITHGRDA